ncbi:MAG: sigma-70 family RNA polymerase sigma factor [Nitriliruptoraceae bacterium]
MSHAARPGPLSDALNASRPSGSVAATPLPVGPADPGALDGRGQGLPTAPTYRAALVVADPAPSWEEIAERYGDTVYTMALRLTGDRDEARDLAQDVFVRVYRNLDRYRPGTFEGWLFRITKNLFLDRLRRRARVRMEPLPDEEWCQPADGGPGPAERMEEDVLSGDLEVALQHLPTTFRTAVVLCDVQGLTYEEIVAATGWPMGTVRSRIHRGRRALRQLLASPGGLVDG